MEPVTATLITHAGAYSATEEEVRSIIAPAPTSSWNPISHATLLDVVMRVLADFGLNVVRREFALNSTKDRMFGTLTMETINKEYALAMGVRNSTNKTMPAGICCGSKVFVCDNMAFSSSIMFGRRHTTHILTDLPISVKEAVSTFLSHRVHQDELYAKMKDIKVSRPEASDFLLDLAMEKIIPHQGVFNIRSEFSNSRFPEFNLHRGTLWAFYNAMTTYQRHDRGAVDPLVLQNSLLGIHEKALEYFKLK